MKIKRIASRLDGTFGVLLGDGDEPFALTLELPWRNNEVGKSCIPAGTYTCKRVLSPKFGNTFEVTNVQGRSHILFHRGNVDDDTHGCILVGEKFESWADKSVSIQASAEGFKEFLFRLEGKDEFQIEITDN